MRLNMGELNKLIPGAVNPPNAMTTILRDPVEHFWHVWNEPEVVRQRLLTIGAAVTVSAFLKDPTKYLEKLPVSYQHPPPLAGKGLHFLSPFQSPRCERGH